MELVKLTKKNQYEHITEQLKQLIFSGELQPGEKLPSTKELSERFGVGRSTTREALSALKAMGLIDIRQGGNCTVKCVPRPSRQGLPDLGLLIDNKNTILELLEARKALEVANAAIAARKREEPDLQQFEQILAEMATSAGDEDVGERTDLMFHRTLAQATHNSIMQSVFETISTQMDVAIRGTRRVEIYANQSVTRQFYEEHLAIFAAIRQGDPDAAQARVKEHLYHVEGILMKYLT